MSEPQYIHSWFKGSTFLQVFFKALKNITDECKGFTADSPIWDHHYHGLGRNKEIVPLQFIQFAKKLNDNFVITAQSVRIKNVFQGQFPFNIIGNHSTNQQKYKNTLTCAVTCFPIFSNLTLTKNSTFLKMGKQGCSVTLEPTSLLVVAIMWFLLMELLIHGYKMF
jgi:hypothetical protein